jgi:hypothetical protein
MNLRYLILAVTCVITGCTLSGFKPPPNDEEALTHKSGPTVTQVRKALNECGDAESRKPGENQSNFSARVVECMLQNGFYFKSGWGGHCSDPEYRAVLPACLNAPVRPRNGYYGQTPSEREQRRLDQDMANAIKKYKAEEARYVSLDFGAGGMSFGNPAKLSNERTMQDASDCNAYQRAVKSSDPGILQKEKNQSVECMLAKGYPLDDEKRVCNWPVWREGISACAAYAKAFAEDQKRVYDTVTIESWPIARYEFMNPERKVMSIFRQEQLGCWKGKERNDSNELNNILIQSIECMLDKGYVLSESDTQRLCRNVDFKNTLSSCLGVRK